MNTQNGTQINATKASASQTAKRSNIENMYPLSPMQEGLLFHSLLSPTSGTYVPQIVLSFSSEPERPINGQLLKQAWEEAVAQHSILRTGFYWEQRDNPFQVVYRSGLSSPADKIWIEQDWQHLSATEQAAKLQVFLACNRSEPFNLNQPPLIRLTLINRGCDRQTASPQNRYYLIWCYHHLILDGWSASQLLKEVFQQYFVSSDNLSGDPSLAPRSAPRAYGEYIAWLNKQDITTAQSFWKDYLDGWAGPTSLPIVKLQTPQTAKPAPPQRVEQQRPLSAKATQRIKTFAQTHKITLNTFIQAALGLVLSRYCDTRDVVFGATCAGRPTALAGALSMVGLFINTLPVRVRLDNDVTVVDWLQGLSAQQAATTDYEYISLRELQQWVNKGKSLFDCLLVFESYPISAESFNAQTDLHLDDIQFNEWTHFPLTILVSGENQ
ncbi:MAG: condensation domain-containing protein, partial [Cyanobacteria bacterium J06555_13]